LPLLCTRDNIIVNHYFVTQTGALTLKYSNGTIAGVMYAHLAHCTWSICVIWCHCLSIERALCSVQWETPAAWYSCIMHSIVVVFGVLF